MASVAATAEVTTPVMLRVTGLSKDPLSSGANRPVKFRRQEAGRGFHHALEVKC